MARVKQIDRVLIEAVEGILQPKFNISLLILPLFLEEQIERFST